MYKWNENIIKLENQNKSVLILPDKGYWIKIDKSLLCAIDKYLNDKMYTYEVDLQKIIDTFDKSKFIINTKNKDNIQPSYENEIKSIYLFVTKRCNLACEFCCTKSNYSVVEKLLDINEMKEAINKISNISIKRIIITGGEPCLRKDLIPIIDYINEKLNCKIGLCSNGLLLTDELINSFNKKVSHMDISVENLLEGCDERKTKNINFLESNIKKLQDKDLSVGLSFVVTKKNYKYIYEFIDICNLYNTDISIKIVAPVGNAKMNSQLLLTHDEAYQIYKDIYHYIYTCKYDGENFKKFLFPTLTPKTNCSAMDKIISISPNGKIYSCHTLMNEKFCLGDIKNNSMKEIIDDKTKKSKSEYYKECFDVRKRDYCVDCNVKYFCGGNCYAEMFNNQHDKYTKKRILCDFYKKLYNFLLWDYNNKKGFRENLEQYISLI